LLLAAVVAAVILAEEAVLAVIEQHQDLQYLLALLSQ
jgi:hypothetical protein